MTQRVVTFESAGHFRRAPELAPFRLSHLQSHRAFLLATPPLLETHIMKTCKLIVCAAPSACRRPRQRFATVAGPESRLLGHHPPLALSPLAFASKAAINIRA